MRHLLLLVVLISAPAFGAAPPDRWDPLSLNEQAAAALQAGDRQLAIILLERAARLAPGDRRIADNLRALRAEPAAVEPAVAPVPPAAQ